MPLSRVFNILTFISAVTAIYFDFIGNSDLFMIFKPLTTILILINPLLHQNKVYKKYGQFILVALLFCLIGDIFLLSEDKFVFGLASFLIAHILFALGFMSIDKWKSYPLPLAGLLVFGLSYYSFIFESLNELAIPVFCYFVFIVFMCWQGIGLYIWRKEFVFKIIAIAVVLFLISDSIIALNKFKIPFELSGLLILGTYWLAISLLANSTISIEKVKV